MENTHKIVNIVNNKCNSLVDICIGPIGINLKEKKLFCILSLAIVFRIPILLGSTKCISFGLPLIICRFPYSLIFSVAFRRIIYVRDIHNYNCNTKFNRNNLHFNPPM